jgi:peptidyl-prolyl cis-trans isomerase D
VPEAELWRQFQDQNDLAEIRYVPLNPATRYEDSAFPVDEGDVEAYYRDNQDEFQMPARASVEYVVIEKTPTASDTVASRANAVALRQRLVDGADFAELARTESADQATAAGGGGMGVVPRGREIGAVDSALFAPGRTGLLAQPVQSPFGFHIIEVMDRWGADSVRARHILVPIARTDSSEVELLAQADSLEDLGEAMPLRAAAAVFGLTTQTTDITQEFPFVAGAGQISEGADWVFEEASPGDVSPVFETSTAFYALQLISSSPAGVLPIEQARETIESTLRFDLKMERAATEGQQLVDRVRGGGQLANVAAEMNLEVRLAGPFARNDFVPGIGRQNAVVGAAFGLPLGQLSDVVSTVNNRYVVEVISRTESDSTAWVAQLPQQRAQAVSQIQQQRLGEWLAALRANARVVDRRAEVLVPTDETAPLSPTGF